MNKKTNTDSTQVDDPIPKPGDTDLPPTTPYDPLNPDPSKPEPIPLPPDTDPTPSAPVREPDTPIPMGDPLPKEHTRL